MQALVLPGDGVIRVVESPEPTLGSNEVLVRMASSGICATDLHYAEQPPSLRKNPDRAAGHEGVGTIEAVGRGVSGSRLGDTVVCYAFVGCGRCDACRSGDQLHCSNEQVLGRTIGGTFADLLALPSWAAQHLPAQLDGPAAAALGCAGPTAFAAVRRHVHPGDRVGVIGLGPVGLFATMFSVSRSASVSGVDPSDARRDMARRLGAERGVASAEEILASGEPAFDVVLECSGNRQALDAATELVGTRGILAIVGTGAELCAPTETLVNRELTVVGSLFYRPGDWDVMVQTILEQDLDLGWVVGRTFDIGQAEEAFDYARQREEMKAFIQWAAPGT